MPQIAVGDKDQVPAAAESDGKLIQVAAEGGKFKVLTGAGDQWTVRDATGPTGRATQTLQIGDTLYLLAGPTGGPLTLWQTDLKALH